MKWSRHDFKYGIKIEKLRDKAQHLCYYLSTADMGQNANFSVRRSDLTDCDATNAYAVNECTCVDNRFGVMYINLCNKNC